MLLIGRETYGRESAWSNELFPLVFQSAKNTQAFLVKLLETNSLKQYSPNQLDKRHQATKEEVVLVATDIFLEASFASLSQKLAIKKR